ncbi:MAG: hypothetical protein WAS55_12820 [Saprospiraceae bacterium]|nr:hypothetical protein [Saprospiraceae bacterium]MBK9726634.1 hypothetical protein [Saprospiraceae bacterium]
MKKNIPNPKFLIFILFLIVFTSKSCTTIHAYQIGGPHGRELGNQPSTEWKSQKQNTYLWGAIRQDVKIENCALADGSRLNIEEFKIEKNFGCTIAHILTLGIWEPVIISWKCAKPKNIHHD